ncbi:MAG TPA: hypothetical protein VMW04_02010 [Patescibacteria group bacterium]|nr:hypothetical protein [Patescibacteria group bacterium]
MSTLAEPNKSLDREKMDLLSALEQERTLFHPVQVPIVTVSATFRKELAHRYRALYHTADDVVFSRAHYSMAVAVYEAAKKLRKTAHFSDPTNYVSERNWGKVELIETVGRLIARHRTLKWLKNKVETIVRNKLPITEAVVEPLLYLTEETRCPIISLHYEAGNILVKNGKKVVQVVTDPHVRPQYLGCLPSENIIYAVFDEETKKDFMKEAQRQKKTIADDQVVVSGPPVDPRIIKIGKKEKKIEKGKPINLAVTTGGLGTNLGEIKKVLQSLAPLLRAPERIRLFLYAGTHRDFRDFFEDFARKQHINIGNLDNEEAVIRILYEDSIIDANENLIKYVFPWAQGFITKPSGDMTYDAAVAGCFLLFLTPWGEWEENIRKRFIRNGIGRVLKVRKARRQIVNLISEGKLADSMHKAYQLPNLFRQGAENIVMLQSKLPCRV